MPVNTTTYAPTESTMNQEKNLPAYRSTTKEPKLPSYNAATATNSDRHPSTTTDQPRRHAQPTPEQRLAMLQEFKYSQEHANDYWGGQKGAVEGPPKDPLKVFRWAARKMSHDEDPSKRPEGSKERWYDRSRSEVEYAKDGEVAKGDVDGSHLGGVI